MSFLKKIGNHMPAFSLAEAMITLLIVSVALAAAAPIISKQANPQAYATNQFKTMNKNITKINNTLSELQKQVNSQPKADDVKELTEQLDAAVKDIEELKNGLSSLDGPGGKLETINNKISNLESANAGKATIPSQTVAFFRLSSCPSGWSPVPTDWQGRYPRIAGEYKICDKSGESNGVCKGSSVKASIGVGGMYSDAIRNITGTFGASRRIAIDADSSKEQSYMNNEYKLTMGGYGADAITTTTNLRTTHRWGLDGGGGHAADFIWKLDASKIVPTASENRVKTVGLRMCIKN